MERKNCCRFVIVVVVTVIAIAGTVTMDVAGEIYSNTHLFQTTRYYSVRAHMETNDFLRIGGIQKPFQNKKPSLIELHITGHLFNKQFFFY